MNQAWRKGEKSPFLTTVVKSQHLSLHSESYFCAVKKSRVFSPRVAIYNGALETKLVVARRGAGSDDAVNIIGIQRGPHRAPRRFIGFRDVFSAGDRINFVIESRQMKLQGG